MANILDAFFVLFQTDADKATAEVKSLAQAGREAASDLAKVGAVDTSGVTALATGAQKAADLFAAARLAADRFADAVVKADTGGMGGVALAKDIDSAKLAADRLGDALKALGTVDPEAVTIISNELDQAMTAAARLDGELDDAARAARDTATGVDKAGDELNNAVPPSDKLADNLARADRNAQNLGKSFSGWVRNLTGPLVTLLSVGAAINSAREGFKAVVDLGEQANRFNFNVEGLNAFNQIVDDMGGNSEDAERYVRRFSDTIRKAFGDASSDPGKALRSIGVSAANAKGELKDTEEVMLDIAGALEKVSKQTAIDRLRRLGIVDPAMIELILKGRTELEKLSAAEKAKGLVTAETVRKVREFKLAMDDAKDAIATVFNRLLAGVAGPGKAFADWIVKAIGWMQNNATFTKAATVAITGLGAVIAAVVYRQVIPAFVAWAIAQWAVLWPILAIGAAAVALGLIIAAVWEDVQFFIKGQPSLIGTLLERYGWLRDVVAGVGAVFKAIGDVAARVFPAIGDGVRALGALFLAVGRFIWAYFAALFRFFAPAFQAAAKLFGPVLEWLAGLFRAAGGRMFDSWIARIKFVVELIKTLANWLNIGTAALNKLNVASPPRGGGPPATVAAVQRGQQQVQAARNAPLAAATSQSITNRASANRSTVVKVEKVTVNTQATDAPGIAKALGGALQGEMRRAAANYDDGISR